MRILLTIACLLLALPAGAQVHPCDTPITAAAIGEGPFTVSFCAKPSDTIVRVEVQVDDLTPTSDAEVRTLTAASATGYVEYAVDVPDSFPVGDHEITVVLVNLDRDGREQSTASPVVDLTVLPPIPPPAPPVVTGVRR